LSETILLKQGAMALHRCSPQIPHVRRPQVPAIARQKAAALFQVGENPCDLNSQIGLIEQIIASKRRTEPLIFGAF
jgi:hypothetical protein